MALTPSSMLLLGTKAVSFELLDAISTQRFSLQQLQSPIATVIMFICNHCPYVKHIQQGIVDLARDYQPKGIAFIAINSNDASQYPEDSFEEMQKTAKQLKYSFPYLYDESQEVAKAYHATCTPDLYIFDTNMECVYQGQFDDSRPGNHIPVTGRDMRHALEALLTKQPMTMEQIPSIGCNIKWKNKT